MRIKNIKLLKVNILRFYKINKKTKFKIKYLNSNYYKQINTEI